MSCCCVYYEPESILFNLFGGFVQNLSKLTNDIFTIDQQLMFDYFLKWLGKLYEIFKEIKNNDLIKLSKELNLEHEMVEHPLNLHTKLFCNFPKSTRLFFLKNDFVGATKKDDDLYLNNGYCDCVEIRPNSFFDNFSSDQQTKEYQNATNYDSVKLPNLFYKNAGMVRKATAIENNCVKLNNHFPENFDFLIFAFKLLDIVNHQDCFSSFVRFLQNESEFFSNDKIINNLKYIDCILNQRIFALVVYFSTHKYYYSKKLMVKWNLIFQTTKQKDHYFLTMQNL